MTILAHVHDAIENLISLQGSTKDTAVWNAYQHAITELYMIQHAVIDETCERVDAHIRNFQIVP